MTRPQPTLPDGMGAGDASSGGGIPLPPESDQDVVDAIHQAFFLDPDLPADSFVVDSVNRIVFLRGTVASEELGRRAEAVAARVQGVNRVINELRVA
jgi:osmotically-inducible protein OsmY